MASIVPKFLDCVVAIGVSGNNGNKHWIGTGFLFGYHTDKDKENEYSVYLVTNKHVLRGQEEINILFNPKGNQAAKSYSYVIVKSGNKIYKEHPLQEVDVAVVPINAKALSAAGIDVQMFLYPGECYTVSEMGAESFMEGDGVYALGFPMGIIGTNRQYVILRGGYIARIRDLIDGYSSDFIIDTFVFPGNSGGPVVIRPALGAIQGTTPHTQSKLIGLVKSYIPYKDVAISPQTNRPRVVFEENTGLTIVEPVDHIIEAIEKG